MNSKQLLIAGLLAAPITAYALSAEPPFVEMQTNLGTIIIQLDYANAPITSANFLTYVKEGFYNNTLFHRAVKNFVIQGGGFDVYTRKNKATHSAINNEAASSLALGLSNVAGTLSMARGSQSNSATSQFFINLADNSTCLNAGTTLCDTTGAGYAVFAKVIGGMSIADSIGNLNTYDILGNNDGFPFTSSNSPVFIEHMYLSDQIDKSKAIVRMKIGDGLGKVSSSPKGINNCGTTLTTARCETNPLPINKKLSIKATAAPSYVFTGWRGDCKGYKNPLILNLTKNYNCTATFAKLTP